MYVVYWTVYYGHKLPRNYIGSTSLQKHLAGYKGSVGSAKYGAIWKAELKNNPHLFKSHIIEFVDGDRNVALEREEWWQRRYKVVEDNRFINLSYALMGFHCVDPSIIEKIKQTHLSKTPDEVARSNEKQMLTKKGKSEEEQRQVLNNLSVAIKEWHQNMSLEDKLVRSENTRRQNLSRPQETNEKISQSITEVMEKRTHAEWEVITNKKRDTWKKRKELGIPRKNPLSISCTCGKLISPSNYSRHLLKCGK